MALVLALDTTSEFGGISLLGDGELIEELPIHAPQGFGHVLFERLRELLERHTLQVGDVDFFAAAAGPGSFTGVRIGLAAAQGLAAATGKPAAGVSNLRALAWCGAGPLRASFLDARRNQIYGAVYDAGLQVVDAEEVTTLAGWLKGLEGREVELVTSDFSPFSKELEQSPLREAPRVTAPRSLATPVGWIAARLLAEGVEGLHADANYVRRSDAELKWKDPI